MDAERFNYDLPQDRIAQKPSRERDGARLLVVDRLGGSIEHRLFRDLTDYCAPGDLLFRNAARVLPARLYAKRSTGGQVECLLLRSEGEPAQPNQERWRCLLRPGRKLPAGSHFGLEGVFDAKVIEKNDQAEYLVEFTVIEGQSVAELAEKRGKMPLPPYIRREREDERDLSDHDRYQTVYARDERTVAAAAPTAGLHFTNDLNWAIENAGVRFFDLTLHVGMGTFKPLSAGDVAAHDIHREIYEVPRAAQEAIWNAPERGERRVCVGTTSVRCIEDYLRKQQRPTNADYVDETGLFLFPPADFKGTDALITNFHLPKSTLLCLVSAFLTPGKTDGIDWLLEIYKEAIERDYRFLSYGDAMLIL